MSLFLRRGWTVSFLEKDLRTPIGRIRSFPEDEQKLRDFIDRTSTRFNLEDKQALDYAFQLGRGGIDLDLTEEQYQALKR